MTGLTTVASGPNYKEKLRFASFAPHIPPEGTVSQDVSARGLQLRAEDLFLKLNRPFHRLSARTTGAIQASQD